MQLRTSHRNREGGVLVLDCAGRIVFGQESDSLRDTVKKLLPDNRRLVLNLSEVPYVDSGGLGTLVGLFLSARSAGAVMKLAGPTPRVTELLEITKLGTVLEVYPSEDLAVRSFQSTTPEPSLPARKTREARSR
jgi:anti-sigma B factor antagonist